jgi:hypothetical protein
MKSKILICLLFTCLINNAAEAQSQLYRTAIGLNAGYNYGITLKHYVTPKNMIEGIANFNYGPGLTVLYEFNNRHPFAVDELDWYYGAGAHVKFINGGRANVFYNDLRTHINVGIDAILGLIRNNVLGEWNKVEDGYNSENQSKIPISERRASDTRDIFEHTRPQQFTEVMSFYSNIKNLKTTFSEKFESNFQQNELKQLNETCRWLHSLEEDIKDFWYSRQRETDLIAEDLDQQLEPTEKQQLVNVRENIARILTKYGIPFDPECYK